MKSITQKATKLKNRFYYLLISLLISFSGFSQNVGINATGTAPNANAGLDVDFSNKGILIPRVSLTSTSSFAPLSAHVAGMVVYNTATTGDVTPGFYYDNGINWIPGFLKGQSVGDMLYWSGTQWLRIPVGVPGQYLQISGGFIPTWGGSVFSSLTTTAASAITITTATSGGNVTNDGGSPVIQKGVCWNTLGAPTVADSKTSNGLGLGIFTSSLTGLLSGTTYHVRAYAINATVVNYGAEITFTTLANIPTVAATTAATSTGNTATTGGNITADGGSPILERGVCYATTQNPTISATKVIDPLTTTGLFVSNLTGLTGGTTYYVRAYATNSIGTAYGAQISFATAVIPPTLVTVAATSISGASAASGGSMNWNGGGYSNYQAYGVAYSTTSGSLTPTRVATNTSNGSVNPAVNITPWVTNITGLAANTTYYIRSYLDVYRAGWITIYGPELSFTTTAPTVPIMTSTTAITGISANTANSGGAITSDGGSAITVKGVCWGLSPNPILGSGNFTSNGTGTGAFISNITGLTASTLYYVRAYATNAIGTSYGPTDVSLTTWVQAPYTLGQNLGYGYCAYVAPDGSGFIVSPDIPSTAGWGCNGVNIAGISNALGSGQANTNLILACSTGTTAASVANDYTGGGFTDWYLPSFDEWTKINTNYNLLGFGWSYNNYYTSSQYGTNYNYAATYFNTGSYAYGSGANRLPGVNDYVNNLRVIRSFGPATLPAVTTASITNITGTTATSGGNVTSDGGGNITAGVCWSTTQNPTIANAKTVDASAIGPFVSSLTGLTAGTTYYVRAYATNVVNTVYGNEVSFTPAGSSIPTLTTAAVSNPTSTGGTFGGNITSDGGQAVTARGVCWSDVNTPPTIADSKIVDGSGTGVFVSNINGLIVGNNYWLCAYATNSVGTAYGQVEYYVPLGTPVFQTLPLSYTSPATTGTSGIYILNYAGRTVVANGIVWGTSPNPTVISNTGITTDPMTSNYITSTLTGLQQGTTYYVRAYLTYGTQTIYGGEFSFTPGTASLASVSTNQIMNKIGAIAEIDASILSDGGDPLGLTAAGLCWSESANPTVTTNLGMTTDGSLGQFYSTITGLTVGTTYHVRAYATNSAGTAYGQDISFTETGAYVGQQLNTGWLYGTVYKVDGTGTHGMIADSSPYASTDWGCTNSTTGATGTAVGTGQTNTASIISDISLNGCTSAFAGSPNYSDFAANVTQWYGVDWYLPSKNEVAEIISSSGTSLLPVSGLTIWSSSEIDATHAWYYDGATWQSGLKSDANIAWPVRSF